jgi:hypothetical protein
VRLFWKNEGKVAKSRQKRLQLLRGYGAVLPIHKPKDFRALREAFEKGVAEDVIASFNQPEFSIDKEHPDSTVEKE